MTLLLCIIYIGFISLGLPDSLFGTAWPTLQGQFGVPLSWAGIVTMTISGGTILSALLSDRLTYRFGAGRVTAVSVLMTAAATSVSVCDLSFGPKPYLSVSSW